MEYKKVYDNLINKSKSENRIRFKKSDEGYVYYENHHIIPKCLGGTNDKENLVLLTAREHFICHKLLTYIHKGNRKIALAFLRICYSKNGNYNKSSKEYEYAKELLHLIPMSEETKRKIGESNKGRIVSEKTRLKISAGNMGNIVSLETRNKISESLKGKKLSEETKEKISLNNKGRIKPQEHCLNLSKAMKGRILSSEHCQKIKEYHTGKKHSEETKEKMRISQKKRRESTVSEETKEKMKIAWIKRKLNSKIK